MSNSVNVTVIIIKLILPRCSLSLRGVFLVYHGELFKIISGLLFIKETEARKPTPPPPPIIMASGVLRKQALKLD